MTCKSEDLIAEEKAGRTVSAQTAAIAGSSAVVSFASSALSTGGASSFEVSWNLLNSIQILIVIGLLEIEYPPKVEAFL